MPKHTGMTYNVGDHRFPFMRMDDGTVRVVEGDLADAIELWSDWYDAGLGRVTFYGPKGGILWNSIQVSEL